MRDYIMQSLLFGWSMRTIREQSRWLHGFKRLRRTAKRLSQASMQHVCGVDSGTLEKDASKCDVSALKQSTRTQRNTENHAKREARRPLKTGFSANAGSMLDPSICKW